MQIQNLNEELFQEKQKASSPMQTDVPAGLKKEKTLQKEDSAFIEAVEKGDRTAIRSAIENGANIHTTNKDGMTFMELTQKNEELQRFIISHSLTRKIDSIIDAFKD